MPRRYRIYLLSAKSILSYAKEEGGAVTIALNRDATRRCVVSGRQEQEENALFFQIQCALHGDWFTPDGRAWCRGGLVHRPVLCGLLRHL